MDDSTATEEKSTRFPTRLVTNPITRPPPRLLSKDDDIIQPKFILSYFSADANDTIPIA